MSLIAWWKLNGNAYDDSPSRDNGTVTGVTYGENYSNIGASGANFTGSRATYIDTSTYNITTYHTVCFWMYCNTSAPGDATGGMLLGTFNNSSNYMYAADNLRFRVNSGSTADFGSAASDSTDFYQRWRHVALVFRTTTVEMFLDGASLGTGAYDGTYVIDNIGACYTTTSYDYVGYLNDVRIYDHVLSNREIKEIARCKVFHVKFDDDYNSCDVFSNHEYSSVNGTVSITTDDLYHKTGTGAINLTNSTSDYIDYGDINVLNPDCSICFWVRPTNLSARQNLWGKAYGGEGSMTIEITDGDISFYWGISGVNGPTYGTNTSGVGLLASGTWTHVVAVRDHQNEEVRWYKNGVLFNTTGMTTWYLPTKGTLGLKIGQSYTSGINGYIDDFRIYHSLLTAEDVHEIYAAGCQIDAGGNIWC